MILDYLNEAMATIANYAGNFVLIQVTIKQSRYFYT